MPKTSDICKCDNCEGVVEFNTKNVLLSAPPKYKGVCKNCGDVSYVFCSKVDNIGPTASEIEAMESLQYNNCRHMARQFLDETRAGNLERDLTGFLVRISKSYQAQNKQIELQRDIAVAFVEGHKCCSNITQPS